MPAPLWENLDAFLRLDDFAVSATLTPVAGAPRTFPGILDNPYVNAELGDAHDRDTRKWVLTVKESDAAGIVRGDVVTIAGTSYKCLSGPRWDGTGLAMLDMVL